MVLMGCSSLRGCLKPVGIFDYMTLVNEQRMHNVNGGTPLYTEADFEAYRNGTKVAANWQDAIIQKLSALYATRHQRIGRFR